MLKIEIDINYLKISKSGLYICASGGNINAIYSINQTNGFLIIYTNDMALKILNKDFLNDII